MLHLKSEINEKADNVMWWEYTTHTTLGQETRWPLSGGTTSKELSRCDHLKRITVNLLFKADSYTLLTEKIWRRLVGELKWWTAFCDFANDDDSRTDWHEDGNHHRDDDDKATKHERRTGNRQLRTQHTLISQHLYRVALITVTRYYTASARTWCDASSQFKMPPHVFSLEPGAEITSP